jgi:hypothetical protein
VNEERNNDLEWCAKNIGWTHLVWLGIHLYGIRPGEELNRKFGGLSNRSEVERYDQSIDLMVELVEQLPREKVWEWDKHVLKLMEGSETFYMNAPADLRLKAYRMVMEGKETKSWTP